MKIMLNNLKYALLAAILSSFVATAFAEGAAPVYDADNPPPSFDGQPYDHSLDRSPQQQQTYQPPPLSLTIQQRIDRLEQQMENLQNSNTSTKLNDLHNELQALRGQLDELTHQLQVLQNQQKSMYMDLEQRLNKQQNVSKKPIANDDLDDRVAVKIKKVQPVPKPVASNLPLVPSAPLPSAEATVTATPPAPTGSMSQPDIAEEQQTYQAAYDLIKSKKYNEAVSTLQKMLKQYPSGQFAANAHYWLGELYGLMGKNNESAAEFSNVVSFYPNSPKVSDAQLKLGLIYAAQFKWAEAKTAFKKVISRYPKTASARLASEQLKQIKQAGH
jgi:tol-pal system protein YbgF